jgi:SAM-dependent methyltransferase
MSRGPSGLAASHGEPSYVWRDGQQRRLEMILEAAADRASGRVLENGCGVGLYLERLRPLAESVVGLEYDHGRAVQALRAGDRIVQAAGEHLPFPDNHFDLVLSHEVLEHVRDDRLAVREIVRVLRVGGRLVLFCPNRWYPFETHGMYWRGTYHFGNIPLLNYLPRRLRDRLAPHVRAYRAGDLDRLFSDLPVRYLERSVIFGAYDNIIARRPRLGTWLRRLLHSLENTPLSKLGLSHFWVVEKTGSEPQ